MAGGGAIHWGAEMRPLQLPLDVRPQWGDRQESALPDPSGVSRTGGGARGSPLAGRTALQACGLPARQALAEMTQNPLV